MESEALLSTIMAMQVRHQGGPYGVGFLFPGQRFDRMEVRQRDVHSCVAWAPRSCSSAKAVPAPSHCTAITTGAKGLIVWPYAKQEELNDGGDSAGRASSQSHGGRARHLGKPPLSQAGSGSPPQTSGGGAATPLPGADSGGLRTAGSSVFGDCEKDLEIQVCGWVCS